MSDEESTKKHQWQTVSNKRKMNSQTSAKEAVQIQTSNRFESLSEPPCIKSQNGTNLKNHDTPKREHKPPPIYIYGVNNLKAMLDNFTTVTENKTYIVKALPSNTTKQN
jgi:hypothetical protein